MVFYLSSFIFISVLMLVGIFISIQAYRKNNERWLFFFFIYLIWSLLFQWAGFLYSWKTGRDNSAFFNISNLGEMIFFCFLFINHFRRGPFFVITLIVSGIVVLFGIINIIYVQGFHNYNLWSFYGEASGTIIFCMLYFYEIIRENKIVFPLKEPFFWITTALFFFFIGDITYFLMMPYIIKYKLDPGGDIYGYISFVLNIIQQVFFILGFIKVSPWKKDK